MARKGQKKQNPNVTTRKPRTSIQRKRAQPRKLPTVGKRPPLKRLQKVGDKAKAKAKEAAATQKQPSVATAAVATVQANQVIDLRPIAKADLLKDDSITLSVLSGMSHLTTIVPFMRDLFGINLKNVTSGLEVKEEHVEPLLAFVKFKCLEIPTPPFIDLQFARYPNERLQVSYSSILRLIKRFDDGRFDNELIDFFGDVINLLFGAHYAHQPYALPNMCFLKTKEIQKLCSLLPEYTDSPTLFFNDTFFARSLQKHIIDGHMQNQVAGLMSMYGCRRELNDQKLMKIVSVMPIGNLNVNVSIDLPTRTVRTMNPVEMEVVPCIGRRKWISKIVGITEHYMSSQPQSKEMYFGRDDMNESFFPSDVSKLRNYERFRFSFFHEAKKDLSLTADNVQYPSTINLYDSGIYSVWYCLLQFYEGHDCNDIVELDSDLRRRQVLLFMVVIRLYMDKINDATYSFLPSFNVKNWLVDTKWDCDLQTVFRSIYGVTGMTGATNESEDQLDQNERNDNNSEDPKELPFMQCESMFEFIEGLKKALEIRNYFFYSEELKSLLDGSGEAFPNTLHDLSMVKGSTISVNVHWNFHTKNNLIEMFKEAMTEVFDQSEIDVQGMDYVLNKKSTYFVSVQAKSQIDGEENNPPVLLSFASVTKFNDRDNFKCLYVDYLGTTTKSPKDVLSNYNHVNFTGKGLGKFMIHLLQCLAYSLSTTRTPTTKITLKAAGDKASFYTCIGFRAMGNSDPFQQLDSVKRHFSQTNLDDELQLYVLNDFVVVDHTKLMFINHVHHPLSDIPLSSRIENSIVPEVHAIFDTEAFRKEIKIKPRDEKDKNGAFIVPIGDVIVQIFKKFKPSEYAHFTGLYETLMSSISWRIYVVRETTMISTKSSRDDLKHPDGNISLICKECDKVMKTCEFSLTLNPEDDDDSNSVRSKVSLVFEHFFKDHFQVTNEHITECERCEKTNYIRLKNARDMELNVIGYNNHLSHIGKELFKKLMVLLLQAHLQRQEILDYFDWHQWRPTLFSRKSKLISNKRRRVETVDAVLGLNEKQLRSQIATRNQTKIDGNRRKKTVLEWEKFWDDMIFLKYMRRIMFVKRILLTDGQMHDIVNDVSNQEVFNDRDYTYWVGIPGRDVQNISEETIYRADNLDRGNRKKKSSNDDAEKDDDDADNDDNDEDEDDSGDEDEGKEDNDNAERRYIRRLQRPRFLDSKWILKNLTTDQIRTIKQTPNRQCQLPNDVLQKIESNMQELRQQNITHIYKYTCQTTYKMKFCNVIPRRIQRRERGQDANYEKMWGDEVTKEWLYTTAVVLNSCEDWYNTVVDPSTTDRIYELPVASVATDMHSSPPRVPDAPDLKYPQNGEGTCGISAFSSAFHFCFNETLSLAIYQKRHEYLKELSKAVKSKKSPALQFLGKIIHCATFKAYVINRIKKAMHWKELLKDPYYSRIMLCIPRSSSFSKDHIIGISQGWIFDGNLQYAIPLNEENLTWSTSHGKRGEVFTSFIEQLQVSLKDPHYEGKSKSKSK